MRKGIPKSYNSLIEDMYEGSNINVKRISGITEDFSVRVSVHQDSVWSPYLYSAIMNEVTKEIQGEVPWNMMFADDIGENLEVNKILEEWRVALEEKRLRVSRSKTEYIVHEFKRNKTFTRQD